MRTSTALPTLGLLIAGLCPFDHAAAASTYPMAAVLDGVRTACSDLSSLSAAEKQVTGAGWTRATDPDATPVGELVRFGYQAGEQFVGDRGKMAGQPDVYSRVLADETLYLVLSAAEVDGIGVVGCRVFDVAEIREIDIVKAADLAGRQPDQTIQRPELTKLTWEPGLNPGQDSFEIFHVPADSPVMEITKISGLAFKADQIGTAKR